MSFGKHIQQLRLAKGLRPEALATEVDCSINTIYAWESATELPAALTRFARLAQALDLSLDDLANLGANVEDQEGVAA